MAASERRFGSRHRNPFSTSRAVRLIVGAIVRGGHRIRGTKTISPRPVARTVDYPTGAVHPAVTAEELVFSVPELLDVCNIRARVIYSIYSENLKPENWQRLAREAAKEFESGAAGVVIPHGTDTLHFTTAALSFMLRDLTAPVVVVGAQRSSDRPSSDAAMNLLSAARVATADLGEVVAVMHGETSDSFGVIHRGTKVRKMHSSRRDVLKAGVISAEDMTPETAYVKLMWVLGHTREPPEVARAMATNVAGEINPRISLDEFAE